MTAPTALIWESRLDREHPLVGRIWDVARARIVEERTLIDRIVEERYVAIGEQHDNPDHHRLEARLLEAMTHGGRKPAAVFEMIDVEAQASVDRSLALHPGSADAMAEAVGWSRSGWPPWPLYRPVFVVAAEHGLPIIAAGLDRSVARRIAHEGSSALEPALVDRFALNSPLDPGTQAQVRREMDEAHCGLLPESMLDPMVLVQRARDAKLADRLHGADSTSGAVLIAGNGHARNDRGAPRALQAAWHVEALAIGLLEVRAEWKDATRYAAELRASALPFDYVWFTPRVSDADHCAEVRVAH